jgi:cellulose synthase/poly-beta-1,6-N-acetylglucosamine synthase-like glycosyltransferase
MTSIAASIFIWSSFGASAFVSVMFLVNLLFFRKATVPISRNAPASGSARQPEAGELRLIENGDRSGICVSVLIPARNEAMRIGPLLDSVLTSEGVTCEICVLDDESQDGTDAIVEVYSRRHSNVRLLKGVPVPDGWSGKQFACYQLAQQAKFDELVFLDADVALSKDALLRAITQRRRINADLLSGFPRQRVVTMGEQLLIPLIHLILLCFLPFGLMRWTRMTGAAAGCGQFFLTTKQAYGLSGGHSSIRKSLHDGIMLPRAYRMSGLKTDLFDAADLAQCRM